MTLGTPVFTKINESFQCAQCKHEVLPSASTCRDHCPQCLHSVHVDVNPGDRLAECGGILVPISYSLNKKKGYMIHYRCQQCGEKRINRFLEIDSIEKDSFEALLKLSGIT